MKIAVVETHWKSISGKERTSAIDYYRSISPITYAGNKHGWTVDVIRGLGKTPSVKDYARLKEYDLVWLSYLDNSVALKYLVDTGTPYTMDFDDDLINIDPTNPVAMQYHPESQSFKTLIWALKHSPNITVSTPHLKKVYTPLREGKNITVLKNSVLLDDFTVKPKVKDKKIVIGYTGGITHYGDIFNSPFWGALNYLFGKYEGKIAFKVLGMMPDLWWKDLSDFRYTGGTSDFNDYRETLSEWIRDVDIAVAPLHHTFFNKSKSFIKAMEYSANGVPIVATRIDPYEEFDNKTGSVLLCEGHRDWVNNLELLINDEQARNEYGKKSLSRVKQLSLDKTYDKWAKYVLKLEKPKTVNLVGRKTQSVLFSCMMFGNMTGSELYVYDLAKEYIKQGIRVGVWATHYGDAYLEEAKSLGIKIYTRKPKEKFDIYHAQQVEPTQRVLGLGKVIQTIHSEILPEYEFPVVGVDKYICVRPSIEAFTQIHTNKPTKVIFNGVDTNLFYRTGKNNGRILFVGKDDYLRHKTIEDLKKTRKLLHFQGTYEEVAEQTRECYKTASIMIGRTTIEGWLCGKVGIVYEVDESGKVKSKREYPPPMDLLPFTVGYMAEETLRYYD